MENPKTRYLYEKRKLVFIGAVIFIITIYIGRLFVLQVVDNEYKRWANNNAFLNKTLYPPRGIIYDRNKQLLVFNQPAYDVMLIMREIQPFDTLDLCNTLNISKERFDRIIKNIKNKTLNPGYSSYIPQTFIKQLSTKEYGLLQEKLYKFPGFYIQNRTIREYKYPNGALLLGDIGEVDKKDIEKDRSYVSGDDAGRSGVEYSYEKLLRGKKGTEVLLRDAHGRIKGRYEDGAHDVAPESGKNITLSIDINLQQYGEELMKNKIGSIIMIEPKTGEVLCMVSSPTFDPKLLVGRQRGKNHMLLSGNPTKPLFNRATMGTYPPGSTYKTAQGLVYQQEKIITTNKFYSCARGYTFRGGKPACHPHGSPLALVSAITTSCNSYFCWGLHDMLDNRSRYPTIQGAFDIWRDHMLSLGFGHKLNIDLPSEKSGHIPNSKFYDRIYKGRWTSSTIISIAIGQGEILTTPIQMCNLATIISNRGYYFTPHIVKEIEDTPLDTTYTNKRYTTIEREHFDPIAEGMRNAVLFGTCRGLNIKEVEVCGKTGTVENPHGRDHSACIGFAPYDNPEVAICVFVENGGFGATNAIPIGRLMFEKFFFGEIKPESKYIETMVLNRVILPTYAQ